MNVLACNGGSWLPFSDPNVDEAKAIALFIDLIDTEIARKLIEIPTEWERKESSLMRILRYFNHNHQNALDHWKEWVIWRHTLKIDEVTDEDIQHELTSGLAYWKGRDKLGRPCLVVTGRMMDPIGRGGDHTSFKKFMIRLVEQGVRMADEAGEETISIVYDRRGLGYEHIDTILHQVARPTADSLRNFYGERLGKIYMVHANWLFWTGFFLILKPFLGLVSSKSDKLVLLSDAKALLTYFDEDQIHLLEMDATPATYQSSLRLGSVRPSSTAAECSISCSQEGQFEKTPPVGSILR